MKTQTIIAGLLIGGASLFSSCGGNSADKPTSTPTTSNPTSAPSEKKLPGIEFEKTEFNFGEITQGDTIVRSFLFTNTGDAPLEIRNAVGSCGCTVPDWPKDPIMPGETSQIKAKFDSKGKSGKQNKTITVTTNANDKDVVLRLIGTVNLPATENEK